MFKMTELRAYFKWHPATYEQALKFARWIFRNMTCIRGNENRVKQINERHVKGVVFTIKDLI